MGTSQHLFTMIFRFSTLTQALASDDPCVKSVARIELMQLNEELKYCQVKPTTEQESDSQYDNNTITSELYRLACRIHVTNLLSSTTSDENGTIQSLVEAFVAQLQILQPNSPSHSILSWPLVIAGFSATTHMHQRVIVGKLIHIYEDLQSEIFSKGAAFLRAKWKKDRELKHIHSNHNFQRSDQSAWLNWHNCPVIFA